MNGRVKIPGFSETHKVKFTRRNHATEMLDMHDGTNNTPDPVLVYSAGRPDLRGEGLSLLYYQCSRLDALGRPYRLWVWCAAETKLPPTGDSEADTVHYEELPIRVFSEASVDFERTLADTEVVCEVLNTACGWGLATLAGVIVRNVTHYPWQMRSEDGRPGDGVHRRLILQASETAVQYLFETEGDARA